MTDNQSTYPQECKHESFRAECKVLRIIDQDPIEFRLETRVQYVQCGCYFEFIGVPAGFSKEMPMTSADFKELRAPIRPDSNSVATKLTYQVTTPKADDQLPN